MHQQWVGLLDCNNFFVSCERLFRPDLASRPVVVLSSNDGCVVARSQEIKDIGIPMGVPYFQVKDILRTNNAAVFSGNHRLYKEVSKRVFATMRTLQDNVQQYSVDEAFFYVESTEETAQDQLFALKQTVEQEVGVPVSVGISLSKTLAKVANETAKKTNGLKLLRLPEWQQAATEYPLAAVWGIGRQLARHMQEDGLVHVADLLAADPARIKRLYGVVGSRLRSELQGIAVLKRSDRTLKQSIMSSRSFAKETTNKTVLEEALLYHVEQVAYELRESGACAGVVSVSILPSRHGDFALQSRHGEQQLDQPISTTRDLSAVVIVLLEKLYMTNVPYKKAGVRVSNIRPRQVGQLSLFTPDKKFEYDQLQMAIDTVNSKYNAGRIHQGFLEGKRAYTPNSTLRSPDYICSWRELPNVKAV